MSFRSYRICKAKYAKTPFDGEGSRRSGGRWNSVGVPIVYTSQSASLAALELLVHIDSAALILKYKVIDVEIQQRCVHEIEPSLLPKGWNATPALKETAGFGDDWVAGLVSAVLKVPSAVVESEYNYLINPLHPDFKLLTIGKLVDFVFDTRLK